MKITSAEASIMDALWRAPGEEPSRALTCFRSVLLAAIVGFGLYTAVKSTYVSTTFGTYTYERRTVTPLTASRAKRRPRSSSRTRQAG